jgi:hypothetical protein
MKKILLLLVAGAVIIGIASSQDGATTPTRSPPARPGSAAVYASIARETDCSALQTTFDQASVTSKRSGRAPDGPVFEGGRGVRWSAIGLGYMSAADDRMRAIACY